MSTKDEDRPIEKLDRIFKDLIEEMRTYVLDLNSKNEKQAISAWIRKLCHSSITSLIEKKNRNLYAQILLQMLLKNQICEPFLTKPTHGRLPTIPAYMSSYLDESSSFKSKQEKSFTGPEWLQGIEFEDSILSQTISHKSYDKYKDVLSPKRRERFMLSAPLFGFDEKAGSEDTKENSDFLEMSELNELELYLQENKENFSSTKLLRSNKDSGNIHKENGPKQQEERQMQRPTKSAKTPQVSSREKELEMKLRLTEGKIQEETLKIQQQHDHMVKKILDRKNNEMSDVKTYYQKKMSELEELIQQHENKANQFSDEIMLIKERHTVEVADLNDAIQRSASSTASEYEKLMYDKLSDFEKEMFNLQKVHRENINELVAEADEKMKMMNKEFTNEKKEWESKIIEIKEQLDLVRKSKDNVCAEKDLLSKDKDKLKDKIAKTMSNMKEGNKKIQSLEAENKRLTDEYETVVGDLRKKSDKAFNEMKKERTSSAVKTAANISELESKLNQYRQTVQDLELSRKRELREKEAIHKQDKMQVEMNHEKKMSMLNSQFEKKDLEYQKKIGQYELSLKEKEVENHKLQFQLTEHVKETDAVIEKFKKEAENNSSRTYQDLNTQLQQLQTALASAKEKIDQQQIHFGKKIEEQKFYYEKQLEQQIEISENKESKLHQKYKQDKELLHQSYKHAREDYTKKQEQLKNEVEEKRCEENARNVKQISQLEAQVRDLREEVIQANSLHKQQLQEVGTLMEEKKQAAKRSEDSLRSKHKSQMEQLRLQLQKEHSSQIAAFTEKMDVKLKSIESEYTDNEKSDKRAISSLQLQLATVNAELLKKTNSFETNVNEIKKNNDEIKKASEDTLKKIRKKLTDELDIQKTKSQQLERKVKNMEVQNEEKISRCLLECEEKMNGMLPVTVKKELEDTIDSMRQQITILQSRANVLQEELNEYTNFSKQASLRAS